MAFFARLDLATKPPSRKDSPHLAHGRGPDGGISATSKWGAVKSQGQIFRDVRDRLSGISNSVKIRSRFAHLRRVYILAPFGRIADVDTSDQSENTPPHSQYLSRWRHTALPETHPDHTPYITIRRGRKSDIKDITRAWPPSAPATYVEMFLPRPPPPPPFSLRL